MCDLKEKQPMWKRIYESDNENKYENNNETKYETKDEKRFNLIVIF